MKKQCKKLQDTEIFCDNC